MNSKEIEPSEVLRNRQGQAWHRAWTVNRRLEERARNTQLIPGEDRNAVGAAGRPTDNRMQRCASENFRVKIGAGPFECKQDIRIQLGERRRRRARERVVEQNVRGCDTQRRRLGVQFLWNRVGPADGEEQ